jgi:hypothetical protein
MNINTDNLAELGSLKITIIEKQPGGLCRVHTYATAGSVPEVTTMPFASAMAGDEDFERLDDEDDEDEVPELVALSS